jgi:hypothetical protein
MTALNTPLSSQLAFVVRLLVGALFGLAIAYLVEDPALPQTKYEIWRSTLAVTLGLIAAVIWAGAGSMRRISLSIWTGISFLVVGYIIWFLRVADASNNSSSDGLMVLVFPLLFIAHELVSSGDQANKWIAPYETYFDEAWKRGVQLGLAILFTMLFWGILWLGAALLGFIGFDWLKDLLGERYFAMPMVGLAFGTAVHLGDIQTKLLANVRSLILGVLSWLLPVITLIGAIFVGSLAVSGLAPLWSTKAATATMLGACIGFVLLINAAYQQGDVERPVPVVLKWCVRGAAILLLVFGVLAAWSLGLRIGQYGLSAERVLAGLGVVIALAYGVAYAVAVFVPGRWMAAIEPTNIGLGMFMCALFIAILTPIATPDRLSVNDQVSRLKSGKVNVADFDWWLLKDETGTYGTNALKALAASSTPAIAVKAKLAMDNQIGERPRPVSKDSPDAPENLAPLSTIGFVFPAGGTFPESFIQANRTGNIIGYELPACLRSEAKAEQKSSCKAALLDVNLDGVDEVLIRNGPGLTVYTYQRSQWIASNGYLDIGSFEGDFDAGKLKTSPNPWQNIIIGEKRLELQGFQTPIVPPSDTQEAPAPSPKP